MTQNKETFRYLCSDVVRSILNVSRENLRIDDLIFKKFLRAFNRSLPQYNITSLQLYPNFLRDAVANASQVKIRRPYHRLIYAHSCGWSFCLRQFEKILHFKIPNTFCNSNFVHELIPGLGNVHKYVYLILFEVHVAYHSFFEPSPLNGTWPFIW